MGGCLGQQAAVLEILFLLMSLKSRYMEFLYCETTVKLRPLAQLIKETEGFFLRNIHMTFGYMN
jgi:hypothetical protein